LSRIRLHKLHREDHQRTGVERDDQGETLADKHAVAIHIRWICETPIDDATRTDRQLTEELCRERGVVRFHLAKGETATPTARVSPPGTPTYGSYEEEETHPTAVPPASTSHGLLSP